MKTRLLSLSLAALSMCSVACTGEAKDISGLSQFEVAIIKVNDADPPPLKEPLPANTGETDEAWQFEITAKDPYGELVDTEGYVRLLVEPGAVTAVQSEGSVGRNVHLVNGKASGTVFVTAVYGPSRLWAEDVGYVPVDPEAPPKCADGKDNDGDGTIDYPADPGCAFADDDTEEGGSFAAGVSAPVHYALPRIADVQGTGTETPYPFEGIQVATDSPQQVVVTRVASDGFYVTDLGGPMGASNSLFAFNFSTPAGMRVCDRVVYLSGTLSEFFGFTELSFPSYDVTFQKKLSGGEDECDAMPAAAVLEPATIKNVVAMESLESALVRIEGFHVASHFGPDLPVNKDGKYNGVFKDLASNCDLNGDGQIDFENPDEAKCSNACSDDPECSEWTSFAARGNYKVTRGGATCKNTGLCIQVQTSAIAEFDPRAHRGLRLTAVTGTMRHFSGGSLNWTIETRCPDDLLCPDPEACAKTPDAPECLGLAVCAETPEDPRCSGLAVCSRDAAHPTEPKLDLPTTKACVRLRTTDDPDEGTN